MSGGLDSLYPSDTHGIPIPSHTLSLDSGILSKFLGGGFADIQLSMMKTTGFVGCAILNIVSAFNWLSPVIQVLESVSDSITSTFGIIGSSALALAIGLGIFGVHWLKGTTHRILYHLGMAAVLMMIGVFMVSPVRFAGQMVTGGGQTATEIGQKANPNSGSSSISQILATKYVREPLFRANYGVNLDDVIITPATDTAAAFTCGNVYDSAILDGVPADEIKDRIAKQCPNGDTMARYAKNPVNLNFELMLGNGVLFVLFVFIVIVCVRLMITGVATVLHGVAVKPSLFFVMAGPIAQVYALRNMIAIPLGGLSVAGDLLLLVLGASFTSFMALAAGSGLIASLITCLSMIALIWGTWRFTRNLRGSNQQLAEQLARSRSPEFGAMRAQEARNAVQRVVTRGTKLAAALSGNPAAATAISALGPGTTSSPRSMSLLHDRGGYPDLGTTALSGSGSPNTGGGGSTPMLGPTSPLAAASRVAESLHARTSAALPSGSSASSVQIPSLIPSSTPQPVPAPAGRTQGQVSEVSRSQVRDAINPSTTPASGSDSATTGSTGQTRVPNPHYIYPGVTHGPLTVEQDAVRRNAQEIARRLGAKSGDQSDGTNRAAQTSDAIHQKRDQRP